MEEPRGEIQREKRDENKNAPKAFLFVILMKNVHPSHQKKAKKKKKKKHQEEGKEYVQGVTKLHDTPPFWRTLTGMRG